MSDNEAVFRAVVEAFDRGDADAAAEYFAEDAELVDYSDPATVHRGRAAIANLIREFAGMLPGLEIEIVDLVASGDRLAAELVARGTPEGAVDPVELRYGAFEVFRDGKIVSEHLYVDSAQIPVGV